MKFRCYMEFHEDNTALTRLYMTQAVFVVTADSHAEAFKLALQHFDNYFGVDGVKLRNINLFEQ